MSKKKDSLPIGGVNKLAEMLADIEIPRRFCLNLAEEIKKRIENKITVMEIEWKKHLEGEGGSCYCLASETSCLPERIKELKSILEIIK